MAHFAKSPMTQASEHQEHNKDRKVDGSIRENTDMKTEKHLAWKTTDLKKMIEKKRKGSRLTETQLMNERLIEVAELMQMSSSNTPAPSFIDDIANVETMLMDLTNKLVATMEKQIFSNHPDPCTQYTLVYHCILGKERRPDAHPSESTAVPMGHLPPPIG